VPRAISCAQFFDVANFGAAELGVVVVAAEGDLVVVEADFLFDPPQPAATTAQTIADTAKSLNPTAARV
jgi:hypothetical protein